MDYQEFLEHKRLVDRPSGFEPRELSPRLFPFQRDIVRWACKRGRAAIFADCGLGKTLMQIEWARQVDGPVLVLAPLSVSKQTISEAHKFDLEARYCRSQDDVRDGVNVTNYEKLDRFDASTFKGVVLDESSILKSYTGAFRNEILSRFAETPYKLACTATPAPNDFMELGNHAEFVGSMTRTEMLSMFFVHDGGETQKWRLKGHAEETFWRWVCSWAVMLRKPSDLGYADDGFTLPPLNIEEHVIDMPASSVDALFDFEPATLQDRRKARRSSIGKRIEHAAALAANGEQWIMWCDLNDESEALASAIDGAVEVTGSDSDEKKENALIAFSEKRVRVLVSKPRIAGFGMNFQNCHNMAFVGLSDSYEALYQATRRCWRFGQTEQVNVHIITASTEGAVLQNVRRKERDAEELATRMVGYMSEISKQELQGTARVQAGYERETAQSDRWRLELGDCVDVVRAEPDVSVDFSIFSPPFASLYTYSNSDRDMGNVRDQAEFAAQFQFLVRELARVTKPGRLVSFHCMNLPTSKVRDGVIGLSDFRGDLIRAFTAEGFIYHSEVVIWKDPVTAMQRTKALGLLHKQIVKDSCMSRQGVPDYLVTMRKPGDNAEPVSGPFEEFQGEDAPVKTGDVARDSINIWQRYASPVWMDIDPSDTLQKASAREDEDERHICPLQLQVIRRALDLWSNPGDLVLSPFAGIGSEGYAALEMGRRFLGVELKRSYWEQARKNLSVAVERGLQIGLFS